MAAYSQQPTITSTGSYFNLPYGTTTFSESENGNNNSTTSNVSQHLPNTNPVALQPVISDNKNSTTYMQSNSQISTSTTHSAETSKSSNIFESSNCLLLLIHKRNNVLLSFTLLFQQIHHTSLKKQLISVPLNLQHNHRTSTFYLVLILRFPI